RVQAPAPHNAHARRAEPMALLSLVSRDALFPRPAYRAAWEHLLAAGDPRAACRSMVGLLALAHEGSCEAALAQVITEQLGRGGGVPELAVLRARFAPAITTPPQVRVELP